MIDFSAIRFVDRPEVTEAARTLGRRGGQERARRQRANRAGKLWAHIATLKADIARERAQRSGQKDLFHV
jgi:hypothetical protein